MELSPRNFSVLNPLTARLAVNAGISAAGLAIGVWLLFGGGDGRSSDSPVPLICGAFLVAASLLLLNSGIRWFLKYRK